MEEEREEEEAEERKMENELMNAIVAEESRKLMQPSVKLFGKQHLQGTKAGGDPFRE